MYANRFSKTLCPSPDKIRHFVIRKGGKCDLSDILAAFVRRIDPHTPSGLERRCMATVSKMVRRGELRFTPETYRIELSK